MFIDNDLFTTTGIAHSTDRLNFRYNTMFEPIKQSFQGKTVLDLAVHNGRWAYVAWKLGAEKVIGIDLNPRMVTLGNRAMTDKGVPSNAFHFSVGNAESIDFDRYCTDNTIVLCMGLLYYLEDPLGLLERIAKARFPLVVLDTYCSFKNVPNVAKFKRFVNSLFEAKHLADYDEGWRVSFHCHPLLKMI